MLLGPNHPHPGKKRFCRCSHPISETGRTFRKKVPLGIRLKSTRPSHGRFWSRLLPREAKRNFLLAGLSRHPRGEGRLIAVSLSVCLKVVRGLNRLIRLIRFAHLVQIGPPLRPWRLTRLGARSPLRRSQPRRLGLPIKRRSSAEFGPTHGLDQWAIQMLLGATRSRLNLRRLYARQFQVTRRLEQWVCLCRWRLDPVPPDDDGTCRE